jgi:hypothetical protein
VPTTKNFLTSLPDDKETLKAMLRSLWQERERQAKRAEEQRRRADELYLETLRLKMELERYKKATYGPRADRSVHSWSFRASLTRNLTMRLRSAALRRAAAMGSSHAVTGFDFLAGATPRIENRADDLIGGGPEGRLGLADVPGRAAGIRAAKVFAVVCQDVVREKISLSRDFLFDLPDGHPYTLKVLPS